MMRSSLAFFRPTGTSTSTPRLRKMSRALGLNSSAMSTLATAARKCPVEPGRQGLQIAVLDGGATPDAQTRRRGAIGCRIERHAFLFKERSQTLRTHPFVDHLEADA